VTETHIEPIEFHYRRGALTAASVMMVVILAVCLALIWFRYPFAGGLVFADYMILGSVVFFGGMVTGGLWLLLARPVAIRLDGMGVSGRHFPDLEWSEIAEISQTGQGRYAAVGVMLKEPRTVFARWSLWEKRFLLKLPSAYSFAFLTGPIAASRQEIIREMNRFVQSAAP
jgi:hypothetical protein